MISLIASASKLQTTVVPAVQCFLCKTSSGFKTGQQSIPISRLKSYSARAAATGHQLSRLARQIWTLAFDRTTLIAKQGTTLPTEAMLFLRLEFSRREAVKSLSTQNCRAPLALCLTCRISSNMEIEGRRSKTRTWEMLKIRSASTPQPGQIICVSLKLPSDHSMKGTAKTIGRPIRFVVITMEGFQMVRMETAIVFPLNQFFCQL